MPSSVILGTARTPFGKMGGGLSSLDATDLGGTVIEAALERSGVAPEQVEQVVFGQVLQAGQGQIPSRQAQIKARRMISRSSSGTSRRASVRATFPGDPPTAGRKAGEPSRATVGMKSISISPWQRTIVALRDARRTAAHS